MGRYEQDRFTAMLFMHMPEEKCRMILEGLGALVLLCLSLMWLAIFLLLRMYFVLIYNFKDFFVYLSLSVDSTITIP